MKLDSSGEIKRVMIKRLFFFAILISIAGCVKFGRDFPSHMTERIIIGKTTTKDILEMFGPPYQRGVEDGIPKWRYYYGRKIWGRPEISRDLTIWFNPNGTVKSYDFTSNFPEDMRR